MSDRIAYLDRLKIFLTGLVVLHHLAITYGGEGGWYYYEHQPGANAANMLLTLFNAVNQSFFMGLFFFISGYFTPASYERKGAADFLKQRLLRFGVPLLGFTLVLEPALNYVSMGYEGGFVQYVKVEVAAEPLRHLIGLHTGPLWFVEALLLFSAAYALYRKSRGTAHRPPLALSAKLIVGCALAVGAANFLIRLALPVGESVLSLQLAYFPAYIALFAGGAAASRGKWLAGLQAAAARQWSWLSLGLLLMLPAVMVLGGAASGDASAFKGGLTWQSAFYSFADPFLGFGISYALLFAFRERQNRRTPVSAWLAKQAFAVYIVHALVATYVAYWLRDWSVYPLLKYALVSTLVLPACVACGWLLRRIPGASKVL